MSMLSKLTIRPYPERKKLAKLQGQQILSPGAAKLQNPEPEEENSLWVLTEVC